MPEAGFDPMIIMLVNVCLNLTYANDLSHHGWMRYTNNCLEIQARIAQLVAYWLGTGEVPGSNPGKAENFSVKISNWIVQI